MTIARAWRLPSLWRCAVVAGVLAITVMGAPDEGRAQLRTISLNTGYDQAQGQRIAVGGHDQAWRVITDPVTPPPPSPSTGRPADVVADDVWTSLNPTLTASFPDSRWIASNLNREPAPVQPSLYQYAVYFSLPDRFVSPNLTLKLSADDHVVGVALNGHSLFSGSGGIVVNAPLVLTSTTSAHFNSGSNVNVLVVSVEDTAAGITGLIVDGAVNYVECDRCR